MATLAQRADDLRFLDHRLSQYLAVLPVDDAEQLPLHMKRLDAHLTKMRTAMRSLRATASFERRIAKLAGKKAA